jgi:enoyl-CoA hydratase/carnithine racemase
MPTTSIIYEKAGPVASVTLNRPRQINAVNTQMRDDLFEVLSAARDDPEVRSILLKGAGERGFCSGADVTEFGTAPSPIIAREVRWARDLWGLFLSLRKPIVVAIHGYAIGAGIEMSLCCDLRIASDDARFSLPEVTLGMIPAAGGTQTVPRHVKRGHALELLLKGEMIGAEDALRVGLVQRVVPRDRLLPIAESLAQRLAELNPIAVAALKEAVYQGLDLPLDEGLRLERRLAARVKLAQTVGR